MVCLGFLSAADFAGLLREDAETQGVLHREVSEVAARVALPPSLLPGFRRGAIWSVCEF
jgi:hypothetical protein